MGVMGRCVRAWIVSVCLVVLPVAAHAQSSITGVVRDSSGGVLPGVTVEVNSPDLVGQARSVVTESNGQYRVIDLRPGTYSVTFSLTGFSTVKREGIELSGAFTATVNAEMKVGSLEETITVTGETPIVDVQSVRRQTVMDNEIINAIPGAKSYTALMVLTPQVLASGANAQNTQV